MRKFIPYGRQYIDEEDIQAVVEVLRSDFITTGRRLPSWKTPLPGILVQNMQ